MFQINYFFIKKETNKYLETLKLFSLHLWGVSCVLRINVLRRTGVSKVLASWGKFNKNKLIASEDLRAWWKAKVNTIRIGFFWAYPTPVLSGTWQIVSRTGRQTNAASWLPGWLERGLQIHLKHVARSIFGQRRGFMPAHLTACLPILLLPTWQLDLDAKKSIPRGCPYPYTHAVESCHKFQK